MGLCPFRAAGTPDTGCGGRAEKARTEQYHIIIPDLQKKCNSRIAEIFLYAFLTRRRKMRRIFVKSSKSEWLKYCKNTSLTKINGGICARFTRNLRPNGQNALYKGDIKIRQTAQSLPKRNLVCRKNICGAGESLLTHGIIRGRLYMFVPFAGRLKNEKAADGG